MNAGSLLGAVFLSSVIGTIVSTAVLFTRPPSLDPKPATPRLATALFALLPMAGGPIGLALVGATRTSVLVAAAAVVMADLLWLPLTRRWSWRGHAAWAATTTLSLSYVAYMLDASLFQGRRGALGVAGSLLLWGLELTAFTLGTAFLWEVLDVAARTEWPRRLPEGRLDAPPRFPFVSLHVPAHNEPPDMVIDTLRSLLVLDYPAYEIVMVDDNTIDTALWHPLRDFCAQHDITFVHLENWPGYKSGALNYVMKHSIDPRTEVIGVIDADYIVDPDYLQRCATLFADRDDLAFVQTPQNYREWEHSSYYRRLFYSYEYFFAVSQPSRNELDGAIFGGTMGLIRREALEQVGGWDEWCITEDAEDAEVSLKMLRAGWTGQHVERPFGHGVMPLTFEALKRQRFRWCFGGMQILKAHWRSLLPWDRSPDNHLSQAQRWSYLAGGLQWLGDLVGLGFAAFLFMSALDRAFGGGLMLRRLAGLLLVLPPLLIALGLFRALAALRLRSRASWRDAFGALGLWLALGVTVALACVRGLVQPEGVFLRTPKTKEQPSLRDAARANRVETTAGALLALAAAATLARPSVASTVLAGLLTWHAAGLLGAPLNSLAAMRADLPAQLRRRRATEWLRENATRRVRPLPVALAIGSVTAAGVVVALLSPAAAPGGQPADVLGAVRGHPTQSTDKPSAPRPGTNQQTRPTPSLGAGSSGTPAPNPSGSTTSAPGSSASPLAASTGNTVPTTAPTAAPTTAASPSTGPQPTPASTSNAVPTSGPTAAPTPRPTPATTQRPTARPTPTPTRGRP